MRMGVVSPEKLLKVNKIVLLVGGSCYGLLYLITGDIMIGLGVILATALLIGSVHLFEKKGSINLAITIITNSQCLLIIAFGILSNEFASTYALVGSSLAMTCLYYDKKLLISQWIILDVMIVITMFFMGYVYPGLSLSFLLKNIIGVNFLITFLYFLLKWGIKFIDDSEKGELKLKELLNEVEDRMAENKKNMENQQTVFNEIRNRSDNLSSTTHSMQNIATQLNQRTENQVSLLQELSQAESAMTNDIKAAQEKSREAGILADDSANKMRESNENMEKLVEAISQIEVSSSKINVIIKNIEDIAFQTNILALNASVEAARAGTAGKGFAVVANEVRTLSVKSTEAAQNSAVLVEDSLKSVKYGASLVNQAAANMREVMESSLATAKNSKEINNIIVEQVGKIEDITQKLETVMNMMASSSEISEQSTQISNKVTKEIEYINTAIN